MEITPKERIRDLLKKEVYIFISTADTDGNPHLLIVQDIKIIDNTLEISDWLCEDTLSNIKNNPNVSITIWDPREDSGYQILGTVQKMEDLAIMDGFESEMEMNLHLPQVQKKITILQKKIICFHKNLQNNMELNTKTRL